MLGLGRGVSTSDWSCQISRLLLSFLYHLLLLLNLLPSSVCLIHWITLLVKDIIHHKELILLIGIEHLPCISCYLLRSIRRVTNNCLSLLFLLLEYSYHRLWGWNLRSSCSSRSISHYVGWGNALLWTYEIHQLSVQRIRYLLSISLSTRCSISSMTSIVLLHHCSHLLLLLILSRLILWSSVSISIILVLSLILRSLRWRSCSCTLEALKLWWAMEGRIRYLSWFLTVWLITWWSNLEVIALRLLVRIVVKRITLLMLRH